MGNVTDDDNNNNNRTTTTTTTMSMMIMMEDLVDGAVFHLVRLDGGCWLLLVPAFSRLHLADKLS